MIPLIANIGVAIGMFAFVVYARFYLKIHWLAFLAFGIGVVALMSPLQSFTGTCSYPDVEVVVQFRDPRGRPVAGVQLQVEEAHGCPVYYYPVDDYAPQFIPTSDAEGILRFHHVAYGLEYDTTSTLVVGIPYTQYPAPTYFCRFIHRGKTVSKIRYNSWRNQIYDSSQPTVTRFWTDPAMPRTLNSWEELVLCQAPINIQDSHECRTARRIAVHRWEDRFTSGGGLTKLLDRNINFPIVNLSITVPD